ncbi:hypothetical protein D3C77_499520 [compost metagenome]
MSETLGRLFRKTVEQINVDRAVLQGPGRLDDGPCLFQALQAVDGQLHLGIQRLHAEADPVETQLTQQAHGRPIGLAGVDFNAVVAVVVFEQVEMGAQAGHQPAQFVMAEERGGAAAEMQLLDALLRPQVAGHHGDFFFQVVQVEPGSATVLGDHFVRGAVVAKVGAEWQVQVER